jgi:hypothetical protein
VHWNNGGRANLCKIALHGCRRHRLRTTSTSRPSGGSSRLLDLVSGLQIPAHVCLCLESRVWRSKRFYLSPLQRVEIDIEVYDSDFGTW